jgi:hypothetical protein
MNAELRDHIMSRLIELRSAMIHLQQFQPFRDPSTALKYRALDARADELELILRRF